MNEESARLSMTDTILNRLINQKIDMTPLPNKHHREILSYSSNWNNKLMCDCFTVFRPFDPVLYTKGKEFDVYLSGRFLKRAVIVDVQVMTLDQVTEWVARLETGQSRHVFVGTVKNIYREHNFDFGTQLWSWMLMQTIMS